MIAKLILIFKLFYENKNKNKNSFLFREYVVQFELVYCLRPQLNSRIHRLILYLIIHLHKCVQIFIDLTENDEGKNKCKDVIKNFISSYFNFFPRVCSFFSILDFYWDFISIGARHKNRALSFIAFTTSVGLHGCCLFRPMNIIEQWKANLVSFGWTKWLFFKLIDWALLFIMPI